MDRVLGEIYVADTGNNMVGIFDKDGRWLFSFGNNGELKVEIDKDIHSPVAQEQCTACHKPHVSDFPNLMKAKERELCLTCHTDVASA